MTVLWGIAPVARLLPPGREVDGRNSQQWTLVIGYPPEQAVIEGTREELFRFAVCVGAAAGLDGYRYTEPGETTPPCPPRGGLRVRTGWRLTEKGRLASRGQHAS